MEKIKSKRETLLFRGHVNSPFSSCSSTWRDWSFSKARIREAKEHHLVSLSGVHLQVVKGAPCRAGWIRCFTDFPSSSPSLLLSQSVNENNSLNQTFGSCLSHVWIGAIRGKAAFLQTRESGNVLTQEPRYHPPLLSIPPARPTRVCRFLATAQSCAPGSTPLPVLNCQHGSGPPSRT